MLFYPRMCWILVFHRISWQWCVFLDVLSVIFFPEWQSCFFPECAANHVFCSRMCCQPCLPQNMQLTMFVSLECAAIHVFSPKCDANHVLFTECATNHVFPRMCCQSCFFPENVLPTMFSPECAVNHGFSKIVLWIMVFPRMCCRSCFLPEGAANRVFRSVLSIRICFPRMRC